MTKWGISSIWGKEKSRASEQQKWIRLQLTFMWKIMLKLRAKISQSHRSWMIKLGPNFYVDFKVTPIGERNVVNCSVCWTLLIMNKTSLWYIWVIKLTQACSRFQATVKIGIKTGQNCIAIFWLYDIQHSHGISFCSICYICTPTKYSVFLILSVKKTEYWI